MSDNFKFYLSASIPFSVVVAVLYMSGYWWTFGIDIFSYINTSELIVSSVVPLVVVGIASVIGILIVETLSNKKNEHSISTTKGKLYKAFSYTFDILAIFLIIGIFLYSDDYKWRIYPVILTVVFLLLIRSSGLFSKFFKNASPFSYVVLFVAIYVPFQAYGYGKVKALSVINGKEFKHVKFPNLFKNVDIRYIGKAGNHFFVWNADEKQFHILDISKYSQIALREFKSSGNTVLAKSDKN